MTNFFPPDLELVAYIDETFMEILAFPALQGWLLAMLKVKWIVRLFPFQQWTLLFDYNVIHIGRRHYLYRSAELVRVLSNHLCRHRIHITLQLLLVLGVGTNSLGILQIHFISRPRQVRHWFGRVVVLLPHEVMREFVDWGQTLGWIAFVQEGQVVCY